MIKIYVLIDPITNEIRYVGKTKYSLHSRLCKHLLSKERNHRANWIKGLQTRNLKPLIELLEEVEDQNWQFWEKYWISQFKTWGFNLVNLTEGGETGIISKLCRKNQLKCVTGRKQTKEEICKRTFNIKKPVLQFDKNNNFILEYESASEAARINNFCLSHITECCNNKLKRKTHKGFIWKYK